MSELYDIFREHPHISTDTRNIGADSIFFALRGATFDGNHFAAEALDKGAAYAVVDDPAAVTDERMVLVGDTLGALQELAREHRRRLAIPILAISGSNGKTTTKELVSRVLAERFEVYATRGNLNNHIGVPLTLLAMTRDTQFGVVEMGASACGEIALLASIAEPNYGILTNIGRAHLEGFGGPEGVRRGKGELFDYLAANGGRAFVPREDATLTNIVPYLEKGYSLYGENFTKSSKVYVNGEKQKSTFLNNTRIVLPSTELSEGDVITVSQVGSSNTIFRTTDEYIYQGGQLVRQEGTGTDTTKSWTEQENEEK